MKKRHAAAFAVLAACSPAPQAAISRGTTTTTTAEPSAQDVAAPGTVEPQTDAPGPATTEPPTVVVLAPPTSNVTPPAVGGSGRCGGDLPPCWVMRAESGGDPGAVNATGCGGRGCFGKWQFDPRTSQGLGYPGVMTDYPESVQDEAARALWDNGRGCGAWAAC